MKLRRTLAIGFAAGMAGAAMFARRNQGGRIYLPLPPGRVASALITGASSGIGAEFARQLAAGGYKPILVARRQERLEELAIELEQKYGVHAEALPADLTTDEGVATVIRRIQALDDLTMLVNNAGFSAVGSFVNVDPAQQTDMVRLHVLAPMQITQAALPGMVERKRGAIINVSSVAGFLRARGNVNYCATKAYLIAFSESLAMELHGSGVQVQALCPGLTHTEFHSTEEYAGRRQRKRPDFLWLSAGRVVMDSLAALEHNRVICIPGAQYQIYVGIARMPVIGPAIMRLA